MPVSKNFPTITIRTRHDGVHEERDGDRWQHHLWSIRLRNDANGREMRTKFRQGMAHKQAPTLDEVMEALVTDARTVQDASTFEEWANDLGYDEDSRKAERIFKACRKVERDLRAFLGDEEFERVMDLDLDS